MLIWRRLPQLLRFFPSVVFWLLHIGKFDNRDLEYIKILIITIIIIIIIIATTRILTRLRIRILRIIIIKADHSAQFWRCSDCGFWKVKELVTHWQTLGAAPDNCSGLSVQASVQPELLMSTKPGRRCASWRRGSRRRIGMLLKLPG